MLQHQWGVSNKWEQTVASLGALALSGMDLCLGILHNQAQRDRLGVAQETVLSEVTNSNFQEFSAG